MKELMLCEILRTDIAAVYEKRQKMEFTTKATIKNIILDPSGDDYVLLFIEDRIDEGTAIVGKDLLGSESEWASFIGKQVCLQGFAIPSIRPSDVPKLFAYSMKEV